MKRWTFIILTVLSLLLMPATAALWVRGYFVADDIGRTSYQFEAVAWQRTTTYALLSSRGRIGFVCDSRVTQITAIKSLQPTVMPSNAAMPPDEWAWQRWRGALQIPPDSVRFLGFAMDEFPPPPWPDRSRASSDRWVLVPLWFVLLVSAVMPTIAAVRWRRRRKQRLVGHCRVCGYDLRATPGRCPECGTVHDVAAVAE